MVFNRARYLRTSWEAKLDIAYQIFSSALVAACPPGFEQGQLVAEMADGYSDIRYDCRVNGVDRIGLESAIEQDLQVDAALHQLRTQMTIPGQKPWSKCKFTLFPDGTFKFDVEYED
jgi:hypothetical protein